MLGVLHVAEKPSLAVSIAKFLSNGSAVERRSSQSIHEFEAAYQGRPARHMVTSVIGHVYSSGFAGAYQSWDVDPVLLFDAPIVRKEANARAR